MKVVPQTHRHSEKTTKQPNTITGVVFREKHHWYVDSLTPQFKDAVQLKRNKNVTAGDIVVVRLPQPERKSQQATLLKVLKSENEATRASQALLTAFEIPHKESKSFLSAEIDDSFNDDEIQKRVDLRSLPFVTIDGESAKDFDDAILVEKNTNGWRLRVAIADVSHYVKPNTPLDQEARRRGNSIYLPDRVIPMLPPQISNGICSLVPEQQRLVVCCDIQLSNKALIESFKFYDAVIKSAGRLTYAETNQITRGSLKGRSKIINESLKAFLELYRALRTERELRGALDFEPHSSVVRVADGSPISVIAETRNDANGMIEEAMIVANRCAARYLKSHKLLPLYRAHPKPDYEALLALHQTLNQCGIYEDMVSAESPRVIQQLLEHIRSRTQTPWIWEIQVLRSMHQATYSFDTQGHFGLALSEYSHFTSPIRRYADLYLHRLIKSTFKGTGEPVGSQQQRTQLAEDLSECERRADTVSRKVSTWLKCVMLKKMIGQSFVGYITGIEDFGVFVELDHYYLSGLIHISDLGQDYFVRYGSSLEGTKTGTQYHLGDRIQVVVVAVSVEKGLVDLVEQRPQNEPHTTQYRKPRKQ